MTRVLSHALVGSTGVRGALSDLAFAGADLTSSSRLDQDLRPLQVAGLDGLLHAVLDRGAGSGLRLVAVELAVLLLHRLDVLRRRLAAGGGAGHGDLDGRLEVGQVDGGLGGGVGLGAGRLAGVSVTLGLTFSVPVLTCASGVFLVRAMMMSFWDVVVWR